MYKGGKEVNAEALQHSRERYWDNYCRDSNKARSLVNIKQK